MLYIMYILRKIGDFFLCLLRDDCQYSIKKILTWIFSGVTVYLILFTDKDIYQLLMFLLALLGIRAFEKWKVQRPNFKNTDGKQLLND
jgi:hypothetical protein